VYNDAEANVSASFRVNLWLAVLDEEGRMASGYPRLGQSTLTGVIAAGGRSASLTLSASGSVPAGGEMQAWCTLDRTDPSPATAIASTPRTVYPEPTPETYGGALEGFVPSIAAPVGRLMEALVEAGTR